jgi:two-component system sensor histidine kinase RegB
VLEADRAANAINLRWLVQLRWGAVVGQLAVILIVERLVGIELPLLALLLVVALEALSNLLCAAWLARRRARGVPEWALAAIMALDVLLLSALLHLSGGSYNPFNFLYLVHIALAAVVLRPRYTWGLAALSALCFGTLFGDPFAAGSVSGHLDHADQMEMHLRGMWVAFAVAAVFIVYFVGRIRRALGERDAELALARERSARSDKLASLATLAAGAAKTLVQ